LCTPVTFVGMIIDKLFWHNASSKFWSIQLTIQWTRSWSVYQMQESTGPSVQLLILLA
jgi:hypothetical protein